ncbi:baseplate J/gp47 family protein [Longirhabdus pacifica]|uniref:baseplate J/gp47 family protein n=1 Tax=Longirhabdus pacifica TaxID=2305227 RepID=UPI0010090185|nr:baseplate J/gp47 family protein [Longirhabdus pacifica]
MAYENVTKDVILERMLGQVPDDIDKRQGSITHDLLSPAAIELAQTYIHLDQVLRFGFADTTYGEYLDLRCAEMGLTRKAVTEAEGQVTFTGPDGTVIPVGTQVSSSPLIDSDTLYYVTTEEGKVLNGSAAVNIKAVTGGAQGNVEAHFITTVIGDLSSVLSVTNDKQTEGGTDEESDKELLDRYLEHVQQSGTSGNANHYLQWAKEVPGISEALVKPLANGPGTVKVIILGDDKKAPSTEITEDVDKHIEKVRPIGADVTVEAATEIPITISVKIEWLDGYKGQRTLEQLQQKITEDITQYLASLAFADPIVRRSQIGNVILDLEAVKDYDELYINGQATGNVEIAIQDGQVAVLSENGVTVTEKEGSA